MAGSLDLFSPPARAWFEASFSCPTEVQERGWAAVAGGHHTLMAAPTGSGKTLAAFFWCLDRLAAEPAAAAGARCRVLYVSPLRALAVDVDRNLQAPLRGLARECELRGLPAPGLRVAIRTGDTPPQERREIERHPPDILVTTPESLFLILTSGARRILAPVRWVIVDEIHSLAPNKRGAHLALSLERLAGLASQDPQRIGLSATQRPLGVVGAFLTGDRPVAMIDAGRAKRMEIRVEVPVEDMRDPGPRPEATGAARGPSGVAPRPSIWPAIHPRLLELIRSHRSTIVFVNSRRLAERLAARLNELAGEELVLAHHGSVAKDQRRLIEDRLRAGALAGIVATSSLELGIDMGAVDLVVQVEAPSSVAQGMQRIGRSGHSLDQVSAGVFLPKHRGDLLETAVVMERMLAGEIEETRIPANPLDVLAQQVVAMCALDQWRVADMLGLVRRAHPFRELSGRLFEAVLDMLSGRYPSDEFAALRPRIVWDRHAGTVRARAGAQRLAVTSGGTIPDRGLYSVHLWEGGAPGDRSRPGRKVGELDEVMVYETHPGENFVLGASTWRVAEITPSQVLVTPAPGEPGKIAFWHGDTQHRTPELGRALGAAVRELASAEAARAADRLARACGFDESAARNLIAYIGDQIDATGSVPDDRTVVVERFRDEIGDWRVCLLTPWGGQVHAPWALALETRLSERLGLEVQSMYTDDGIALRLPEADAPPAAGELFFEPEEIAELVTSRLHDSALFAARFRENAARALLLPRRGPGRRTPLWQQRQRAADLLEVASQFPDFPIVLETYRECLTEVFDLDALRSLMSRVRSREVAVVSVDTERASPFSSALLFDYVGRYIYEGDAPLAERRAQALSLDRELLAELLGTEDLRELIDPDALTSLEAELQGLVPERFPRDLDQAADVLRRLGDLTSFEVGARGVDARRLAGLASQGRAVAVRIAGEARWIAAQDAGRYRDALGVELPTGLPEDLLGPSADALPSLCMRWALTHVPFTADAPASRWGIAVSTLERALAGLCARGRLLTGEFRPGGVSREYCHPDVLRRLRRRSLAALRREVEAVEPQALGRFLPAWQGVGLDAGGADRLVEAIFQLQGAPVPASVLERDILPARVAGYSPRMLDELISKGEVVWLGRGALGPSDGRVALYLRRDAAPLLPPAGAPDLGDLHERIRERLARRGASFFDDLQRSTSGEVETVLEALWDLVWAGLVTNDTFGPLRVVGASRPSGHRRPRGGRLTRLSQPRTAGRWSLVGDLGADSSPTERLHAIAGVLLQRHGVVTREAVLTESWEGGFAGIYPVLRAMEEAGRIRRGYFVDGLGGSQFALPGAVDRLRGFRHREAKVLALAATDPANPYGAALDWPASAGRPARIAGAYVLLDGGEPAAYLERGGHSLLTFREIGAGHLRALAEAGVRRGRIEIQRVDSVPVHDTGWIGLLREAGFESTPRGMASWRSPADVFPRVVRAGT
ncbi:MAG: Lhr family helicase [Candidatus Dormibacteraceae bacterium]